MPDSLLSDRRSLGLKFLLVCALAILMSIPAFGVFAPMMERMNRATQVVQEVGERSGGEQAFMGPLLVAPYEGPPRAPAQPGAPPPEPERGLYVVFAETGTAEAAIDTEVRTRGQGGLFKVRTYVADVAFAARFQLGQPAQGLPPGAVVDWSRAALVVGARDVRGAQAAVLAVGDGAASPLEPGSGFESLLGGRLRWLSRPIDLAAAQAQPDAAGLSVTAALKFTGVESVSLGVFAKDTTLTMRGDWPHVGYFGSYPVAASGEAAAGPDTAFSARWTVPFVARGVAAAGPADQMQALAGLEVQTRLIDPANPYQAVSRALKYALLFIGVVFLSYFLFEALSGLRAHPAQYILVGLAQVVFYLLLLSLAERIGFDLAFLAAASATVLLIGWYAGAVFKSFRRGLLAVIGFAALYGLIYLLMRLEDFALLAGALASFVAIAAVMWATRKLDWYGLIALDEGAPRKP